MLSCFSPQKDQMKKNKAFTLVEMMIVMVIIGALASVAVPSYTTHIERVRASEGVQNLTALLSSQKRYFLENSAYAAALASLDIDIPASNNFDVPTVANNAAAVASIARNDATYTLTISAAGVVTCAPTGAGTLCARLGY
jgi:type IV pilus assembly protein PilE